MPIQELATLRFLANGENIILLGPPAVGKTHLAVALGMEAVANRHNVYFITVLELLDEQRAGIHHAHQHTGHHSPSGWEFETGAQTKSVLRWGISDRRELGSFRLALAADARGR